MKKFLFIIATLFTAVSFAQNGTYSIPVPFNFWINIGTYTRLGDLQVDGSNNIWIITENRGLGKFDGTTWTAYDTSNSAIGVNTLKKGYLKNNSELWLSTLNQGVIKYDGINWTRFTTGNSGLPTNKINCIAFQGNITWFATDQGLIKHQNNNWWMFNTSNSGLISDTIYSLASTATELLIGSQRGFTILNNSQFTNYTKANSSLLSDQVYDVFVDNSNTKWILSSESSSNNFIYNFNNGTINRVDTLNDFNLSVGIYYNSTFSGTFFKHGYNSGVSFGGQGITNISGTETNTYYPANSIRFIYNASNDLYYYGKVNFNSLNLFDRHQYNGLGLGITTDNYKFLDVNNVKAGFTNRGEMFWDLGGENRYEVPKGSNKHSLSASSIWIGGFDPGGVLHQAAVTYGQNGIDYFPGPLDTITGETDSSSAAYYDRIWKLNRSDIDEFRYQFQQGNVQNGSYIPNSQILSWPANGLNGYMQKMAPYIDVNGNGEYNPIQDGDYPEMKGDQMLYWIFNDNIIHWETEGIPLKVEIHASAYAFNCPQIADSNAFLNYTTFYNYKLYNRSQVTYDSCRIGVWLNPGIGDAFDDGLGSVPEHNYLFTYNLDNMDGNSPESYGANPPILSIPILNGPISEPYDQIDNNNNGIIDEPNEINLLTSQIYYENNYSTIGYPNYDDEFYNYTRSIWRDSTHLTFGGNGYGGSIPWNHVFSGSPYNNTSWSNNYLDIRSVSGVGSFTFDSQEAVELDYAIIWTRDTLLSQEDQFYKNQQQTIQVQNWFNNNSFPYCGSVSGSVEKSILKINIFPNPATNILYVDVNEFAGCSYSLFDITGKEVLKGSFEKTINQLPIEELKNGMYLLQIQTKNQITSLKFIKQ